MNSNWLILYMLYHQNKEKLIKKDRGVFRSILANARQRCRFLKASSAYLKNQFFSENNDIQIMSENLHVLKG